MRNQDKLKAQRLTELNEPQASEARLRLALESAGIGVLEWDVIARTVTWTKQVERIFGFAPGQFTGLYDQLLALTHPEDRARIEQTLTDILAGPTSEYCFEHRFIRPDGSPGWAEVKGRVQRDEAGRPLLVTSVLVDNTIRKTAEIALQQNEERYRNISETVSDYAYAFRIEPDGSAVLEWVTDAFTRLTGYASTEIGDPSQRLEVIYPEDRPAALQAQQRLLAGQPTVVEFRLYTKDGRLIWLRQHNRPVWDESQGRVVRIYGAAKDITSLKQMEQKLNQVQKMEAIGRLAGGIAHDFNNILTIILGNCSLILDDLGQTNPLRHDIDQIQQAADRAAVLTRQLLAFSRQQLLQPTLLQLNEVLGYMHKLVHRLIGEDIELNTRLEPNLGWVQADQSQIEQVIMNLAVNARDAMPNGGMLFIETANIYLGEIATRERDSIAAGAYVMLAFSDTGIGMDAATRSRIFEPFFTTKEKGQGTGLGLATVHGIINQSGGHIWVYSEPHYGTTFKVYLPRVEPTADILKPAAALQPQPPHGSETILLVEDETPMRELAARVLRGQGYQVLEANNGASALRLSAQHPAPIHLLLTDLIMPGGLNGRQLAGQLIGQRPALKVLYMSGYTDNIISHYGVMPDLAFLQKPFTPAVLAQKVWEVLHRD